LNPILTDSFGREHDYLRISLTDACNLRCLYCMPDEKVMVTPGSKMMSVKEIFEIATIFTQLGIKKIRLTGGEPLVRADAAEIMKILSSLPVELSISTNGVLADEYIDVFRESGIRSVNLSLDTLNADEFFKITRRGDFKRIKGVNENRVNEFIEWTRNYPLHVRFIEFMPFSGNKWLWEKVFSLQEMLDMIGADFDIIKIEDKPHDTTKNFQVRNFKGKFGIISTMTSPFCGDCNRMRLTADGKMKNCLFSKLETDLLSAYRNGEDILPLIASCLQSKKAERGGQFDFEHIENRSMIRIGG
jgi:cyclic pyranopterin phosphate synthase